MERGDEISAYPEPGLGDSSKGNPPSLEAGIGAMFSRHENLGFIEVFKQVIDGLTEQIALVDDKWDILAVNPAWKKTAAFYDYDELRPGANYRTFCEARARDGHKPAAIAAKGIRQLEAGERSYRQTYHGSGRWKGFTFQLFLNRIEVAGQAYATVTRYDVSELVRLRQLREEFSHSLIEGQAEERRRIAREVHDSTMQLLVGLGFSIGQLRRTPASEPTGEIADEMEALLTEAQLELRSISYLCHPPQVRELGLAMAIEQLVGGFGRRTGLNSITNVGDSKLRLSPSVEAAAYRLVQEALSNVHRHSCATDVAVGLFCRRSMLHVAVVDNGIGMPGHVRRGVGLSSMRERIEEIGGRLMIRAGRTGTLLIASVPTDAEIRQVGDLAIAI